MLLVSESVLPGAVVTETNSVPVSSSGTNPVLVVLLKPHQPFNILIGHLRYPFGVEVTKSLTISLTLPKDCYPTQSGLRAFQYKKLEQCFIVSHQLSPLLIVVRHIQLVSSAPTATPVY